MIHAFICGFLLGGVAGIMLACIAVMANDKEGR